MLFNTLEFLLFFPIVAIGYYAMGGGNRLSNNWLLIASYYFYINLKPVYALILLASTLITFVCGLLMERNGDRVQKKKTILEICLVLNFSILFIFKYYNFINGSIESLMAAAGLKWNVPYLNVLLPVGISFFTFQSAGYMIDVYRGTVKAEKNFLTYALFVSFFPVILAGPIQRSKILIPQLKEKHPVLYDNAIGGLKMMLWGYFMKLCVADRLGIYVDAVFNNLAHHNGTTIGLASLLYTIQIYGDFAGYSLVALGCAKCMGFNLPENFHRPYFSKSIKEFWKRWHIGLSSWFMEYLYFPLGGSRVKYSRMLMNLMIVFLVSGLWHGAAWTFIVWGGLHGLYLVIYNLLKKGKLTIEDKCGDGNISSILQVAICFVLVSLAWIFFRADSVQDAFFAVKNIFTSVGSPFVDAPVLIPGIMSLMLLIAKDWVDEYHPQIKFLQSDKKAIGLATSLCLCAYVLLFGVLGGGSFIYFQF